MMCKSKKWQRTDIHDVVSGGKNQAVKQCVWVNLQKVQNIALKAQLGFHAA